MEINNPSVRQVKDKSSKGRALFELQEDLVVKFPLSVEDGEFSLTVPKGYLTDFASVPSILWPIFPPIGQYSRAAIVHDFLCTDRDKNLSRFFADAVFRELMKNMKVPKWRRVVMYYAVRLWASIVRDI